MMMATDIPVLARAERWPFLPVLKRFGVAVAIGVFVGIEWNARPFLYQLERIKLVLTLQLMRSRSMGRRSSGHAGWPRGTQRHRAT
jgi:hypothetical protein